MKAKFWHGFYALPYFCFMVLIIDKYLLLYLPLLARFQYNRLKHLYDVCIFSVIGSGFDFYYFKKGVLNLFENMMHIFSLQTILLLVSLLFVYYGCYLCLYLSENSMFILFYVHIYVYWNDLHFVFFNTCHLALRLLKYCCFIP